MPAGVEPELEGAVADFDEHPPVTASPIEPEPDQIEPAPAEPSLRQPEPEAPPEAQPAPEPLPEPEAAAPAERPRRGSTVREPAPFLIGQEPETAPPASAIPAAPPEAEISPVLKPEPLPPAEEKSETPRRTGWWARRFASKKS